MARCPAQNVDTCFAYKLPGRARLSPIPQSSRTANMGEPRLHVLVIGGGASTLSFDFHEAECADIGIAGLATGTMLREFANVTV
jgi:hypothetical protein